MTGPSAASVAVSPACYTVRDICRLLQIKPRQFRRLRERGLLPFLEEIRPSLGPRTPRYRVAPVDAYLRNQWQVDLFQSRRYFRSVRKLA